MTKESVFLIDTGPSRWTNTATTGGSRQGLALVPFSSQLDSMSIFDVLSGLWDNTLDLS